MCSFNFHNSFIVTQQVVIILNSCFAMQVFDVRRCVGQGDSLSAYLFIITLKALLVIMSDEEIKGIAVKDKVIRIAAFAMI